MPFIAGSSRAHSPFARRPVRRPARRARVALAVLAGLVGPGATQAGAAPLALFDPPPAAPVVAPVAAPISADPAGGPARGTMILVHAGGWAGHSAYAQELLMGTPGALLLQRGWRVVSIDYEEGQAGLQDVLDAAGAELARGSSAGPLCIYGESSGGHLGLVAASRLRSIDCVIGLGSPTDLLQYQADAAISDDNRLRTVAYQMNRFFGTTAAMVAAWDPVALAPKIDADVVLMHEGDDTVVAPVHNARMKAARPSTQTVELEAGDRADPSTLFVHGTLSASGRAAYGAAIGSAADRAVAAEAANRRGARTGCPQVSRSVTRIGVAGLQNALRCLARSDPRSRAAGGGRWSRTAITMRGEVSAARLWTQLQATASGRRALLAASQRRAKVAVRFGDASRVILRATRTAR